jgi:putative PIN family toxin of toxin-antitoxin system
VTPSRVVFDCNTLLQGLASPHGPAGTCTQLVLGGEVQLFLSTAVIDELRDVGRRPRVARKLGLDSERLEAFIQMLERTGTVLTGFKALFVYGRDPDDAHYVNLALAAGARLIVSRDRDLLDLMDGERREGADFQRRFPSLRVVTPVEFLREREGEP